MHINIKKLGFKFSVFWVISFGLISCQKEGSKLPDYHVATQWADLTLFITKNTPANSPTYASRCLGYIGLTQYESVVHAYSDHQSLAGQLSGLDELPKPNPNAKYNWLLVLNSAQSKIIKSIYTQTSDQNKKKIDSLEYHFRKLLERRVDDKTVERSVNFGVELADAIFEWSKTDGGHRAYLFNFDSDFFHEEFPGSWEPPLYAQSFSHRPLHPYWGENRTFTPKNDSLPAPFFIPYNPKPGSDYHNQFFEVYKKSKILKQDEKRAAIWWSDDPDVTFSPGGHLYYIANQLIRKNHSDLITATKTFALVGMSVADAFIKCWKWKYLFFAERPNTFIPRFIDQEWESFWPDPPFPSFPSGHAIQASAAATSLISIFGNHVSLIDSAHVGRERDHIRNVDFVARKYNTIWEIADETANSRFYGGIHTEQDNRVGLEQGKIIAQNIIDLNWSR